MSRDAAQRWAIALAEEREAIEALKRAQTVREHESPQTLAFLLMNGPTEVELLDGNKVCLSVRRDYEKFEVSGRVESQHKKRGSR